MTRPLIRLVDLKAALAPIRAEVFRELERALDGMQLFLGPNVQAFESEFAAYCGAAHGVGVSSGTDALSASLRACGIGPGDEVVVPSLTFFATVSAVLHVGATPVIVDVEPATLTIDVDEVRAAITSATRAIVPVHLYGHPADMDPILAVAGEHGLRVIEDAAQAHGARYRGRRCGSIGDLACFSFYFTKNLGGVGEGGFVTTNDGELAERLRLLRHHGHVSKHEHAVVGYNLRLDEIQAVVLRLKLPRLDAGNARRRALAVRYAERLAPLGVTCPSTREGAEPVHHVYPIRVRERDALVEHLAAHGIETGIHYRTPAHRQSALRGRPHRVGRMTVTERVCAELLSIPMYPELADEQADYVADQIRAFLAPAGAGSRRP